MAKQERCASHTSRTSLIDHIMSLSVCFPFHKQFVKGEGIASHISESLSLLKQQEEEYQSFTDTGLLKSIQLLKLGLHFLDLCPSYQDDGHLNLNLNDELCDVRLKLHSLSKRPCKGNINLDLDRAYSSLQEKMRKLLIRQKYSWKFPGIEQIFRRKRFIKLISGCLLSYKADAIAPLTKEIEDIREKLMPLQALFTYIECEDVRTVRGERLTHLSSLLQKAARLIYFCLVEKDEETLKTKQELADLVEKTNPKMIYMEVLIASKSNESTSKHFLLDNLIKLLDCNAKLVICLNDPSKNLYEKLKFLQSFIGNLPDELRSERFNFHFTTVEAVVWKVIAILCSSYDKHMKEEMDREVDIIISEVLVKIKLIQEDSEEVKLHKYPKIDGEGFLDFFLGHLEKLLKCRPKSIEMLRNQIETLRMEFHYLRSLMIKIKGPRNGHEQLGDLWTRFIGLAYQTEYVIDSYLVKNTLDSRIMVSLSKIIKQTKLIKTEATTICTEEKYHTQAHNVAKTPILSSSKATNILSDDIVGFVDEAQKIKEYLFEDQKKLDIISIVGMAGLGKTTLANKVYEDPSIREVFHVQSWCTVSQTYQKRQLLLTILGDVIGTKDLNMLNDKELVAELLLPTGTEKVEDGDIAQKLYQSLKGHKYLIVMDDLWEIKDWYDLKRSFPDDKLRSRILMTSRYQNLASQIKDCNKVHTLHEFSDVKSWELFEKKLFQKGSFSREFLDVGRQIVESCKGLPLTIVIMAGVLASTEKSIHKWKQIARELSSHIFSDLESQCKVVLESSYNHLPDHLKSCFLYFAAFPEDEEITLRKLKLLWIAEGLVRSTEGKKLEDIADNYFLDLINRSLVIPTKESSHGRVKACRVHDLLHNFCLQKAKEGSFLQVIHVNHWSKFTTVYDEPRLSIASCKFNPWEAKRSFYDVRSLLYNAPPSLFEDLFFSENFKLLRVLDLSNTVIWMCDGGIELLIHLRYLAFRTRDFRSSIVNLLYLQTLLVDCGFVPYTICYMANLRHVRINHRKCFGVLGMIDKKFLWDNVQTLSTPEFVYKEDAENFLRRVPNLRKLRCQFYECWVYSLHNGFVFPDLSFLDQLESLKLFIKGSTEWRRNNCEFYFPPNLHKLSLLGFLPNWKDIAEFGRNLKVLNLSGEVCDGEWIVNDGDFQNLEYLKLRNLSIRKWIATEDSFPKLEQLTMIGCRHLDEIPPCFGELYTLRVIRISYCTFSVKNSAKEIQTVQHAELQNKDFKVYII